MREKFGLLYKLKSIRIKTGSRTKEIVIYSYVEETLEKRSFVSCIVNCWPLMTLTVLCFVVFIMRICPLSMFIINGFCLS